MTRLEGLCIQEKVAYDMLKSSKTTDDKSYYKKELNSIRKEIEKNILDKLNEKEV